MSRIYRAVLNVVGARYAFYNEWEWALIDGYCAVEMSWFDRATYALCERILGCAGAFEPRTLRNDDDLPF